MKPFLHELLIIAKLSTGRRVTLYNIWRPIITGYGIDPVLAYLDRALAHDVRTRELETRWAAVKSSRRYHPDLPIVDGLVDRLLSAIRDFVDAQTRGLPDNDPLVIAGTELIAELFPAGVHAITSLPYHEQAVAVEVILEALSGEFAGHVSALGLGRLVTRLIAAVGDYRHMVDFGNGEVVYSEVKAAHNRGLDYMVELLCMVLGHFHDSDNPAHMAERKRFLKPLLDHDRAARIDRRERRSRNASTDEPPVVDDTPPVEDDAPAAGDDTPPVEDGAPAAGDGAADTDAGTDVESGAA